MTNLNHLLPEGILSRLDQTPFLSRCRSGTVTRRELEIFLVQHFFYAKHFTRYLFALLANLVNDEDRLVLTENLFEEMGLGQMASEPHAKIYKDMLKALNLSTNQPAFVQTEELVKTMLSLCSSADPMIGLAALCLGAEAIVPHVYAQILSGLRSRGFPEQHLRFFPMHIEGDDEHALTMLEIIERELLQNPLQQEKMLSVAGVVIEKRIQFFEAITEVSIREPMEESHAV